MVVEMLKQSQPENDYNITAISTMGDKNQVTALHDFGAKSLWTFELEAMLLNGEVDLIVHCLKGATLHYHSSGLQTQSNTTLTLQTYQLNYLQHAPSPLSFAAKTHVTL